MCMPACADSQLHPSFATAVFSNLAQLLTAVAPSQALTQIPTNGIQILSLGQYSGIALPKTSKDFDIVFISSRACMRVKMCAHAFAPSAHLHVAGLHGIQILSLGQPA